MELEVELEIVLEEAELAELEGLEHDELLETLLCNGGITTHRHLEVGNRLRNTCNRQGSQATLKKRYDRLNGIAIKIVQD